MCIVCVQFKCRLAVISLPFVRLSVYYCRTPYVLSFEMDILVVLLLIFPSNIIGHPTDDYTIFANYAKKQSKRTSQKETVKNYYATKVSSPVLKSLTDTVCWLGLDTTKVDNVSTPAKQSSQ